MRSFLIISTPCFPLPTLHRAWRQLSSEALLAANNARVSFTLPSGAVSSRPPPDRLQQSELSPGIPVCSFLPLLWGKKPHKSATKPQTAHPNKTTSKSSLFLPFLRRQVMGWLVSTNRCCFLPGPGSSLLCARDQAV